MNRRVLPIALVVALPQLAFLRALFVRACDYTSLGSHGTYCYLTLPWTTVAANVLEVAAVSVVLAVLLDNVVVRRLPGRIRASSPDWLTAPSNPTLAVSVALCLGLALLTISDPRLSVYQSFDTATPVRAIETVLGWGLYLPSAGIGFGGNYFVSVMRGMVGVTALPVRLLILGLTLFCSFLQVVWLYAVAAALVGGSRRVRIAFEPEESPR